MPKVDDLDQKLERLKQHLASRMNGGTMYGMDFVMATAVNGISEIRARGAEFRPHDKTFIEDYYLIVFGPELETICP